MKSYIQCSLFLLAMLILWMKPNYLVNISQTVFGEMIFVGLLIGLSLYDKICGLIMLLLIIALKQSMTMEGLVGKKRKKLKKKNVLNTDLAEFRKKYCKGGMILDDKGQQLTLEDIGRQYPKLNFDANKCNPCDSKCKVKVSSGAEQLHVMEGLRPEDSNNFATNKTIDTNEKQVETFNNIFSMMDNVAEPEPVLLKMSKMK